MFEKALEMIRRYDTIVLHVHRTPDGDAFGCLAGMKYLILDNFPDKKVYMVGDNSERYQFITGQPMDIINDTVYNGALAIILDTPSREMVADKRFSRAEATLRFDHHIFVEKFADEEFVDSSSESCCGVLTDFAMECKLKMTKRSATALLTGIVTDSGRFRYDSTTSATFRRASSLMQFDVEILKIYEKLYMTDMESVLLNATFALKIKLTEHRAAYIYATENELRELGVPADVAARRFVFTMGDIKGVRIWALFAESQKGIYCEMRSRDLNVNQIAVKYGGGGHERASGVVLPNQEVVMKVIRDLDRVAATV